MRCEVPELKRCCFCIPLRRGLIAWGYFKLGLVMLLWFPVSVIMYFSLAFGGYVNPELTAITILFIIDLVFTVSFLIAAHTKNFKLFKIHYYYIMVFTILTTIITFVILIMFTQFNSESPDEEKLAFVVSLAFLNVALQVYIMILIKSEINKLENNCQFQFVNNESQAQIKSNLDENVEFHKEPLSEH